MPGGWTQGDGLGIRVRTCGELQEAVARAAKHEGVTLVECIIDRCDTTTTTITTTIVITTEKLPQLQHTSSFLFLF